MFQQIHFRAGRQINPTASPAAAKPRHWDQLTATATGKECASCPIEPHTGELKIEWFVAARIVIAGIRQITECDPRHQPTVAGLQVKLAPRRCAVSGRLRVIRARDFDRACNGQSARRNQGRQKNRDSHVADLIDYARVRPVGHELSKVNSHTDCSGEFLPATALPELAAARIILRHHDNYALHSSPAQALQTFIK